MSQRSVFSEEWTIKCFLCWQKMNRSPFPHNAKPHPIFISNRKQVFSFPNSKNFSFPSLHSLNLTLYFIALNDFAWGTFNLHPFVCMQSPTPPHPTPPSICFYLLLLVFPNVASPDLPSAFWMKDFLFLFPFLTMNVENVIVIVAISREAEVVIKMTLMAVEVVFFYAINFIHTFFSCFYFTSFYSVLSPTLPPSPHQS